MIVRMILLTVFVLAFYYCDEDIADKKPLEKAELKTLSNQKNIEVHWLNNLDEAIKQAKKKNQSILVDFWAEWCAPCKIMEKELFESNEFKRFAQKHNIILVRIDFSESTEANDALAKKYDVEGMPTVLLLTSEGKLIKAMIGYKNKKIALKYLKHVLQSDK